MKILFLFPYPQGESPSQRFRFEQYFGLLEKHGIRFVANSFWDLKTWQVLYKEGNFFIKIVGFLSGIIRRFNALATVSDADYVFIHRECAPVGPPFFEWVLAKVFRKKIIYDFDDAIWLPNTSQENKIASLVKWHSKTKTICRWSYKVSCGNAYLAEFAQQYNERVFVIPTTIDTDNLHNPALYPEQPEHPVTIGWTGTHSTMKYLDRIVPVISELENKYPLLRFLLISNKRSSLNLKSLVFLPWKKETEIEDLLKIDIGIMPLEHDAWSEGKCGFKALQYMALKIPTVASPVGVNNKIIDHGMNGFLCETNEEWILVIEKLICDERLRKSSGEKGREKVVQCFSVSAYSAVFLALFE